MKKSVTISWSGGKDSALSLHQIQATGNVNISGLHTVINSETRRVGMHGIHESLIDKQAEAIGLPITKLYLEPSETHAAYKKLMDDFYRKCACEGINGVVFGDIFLEDLKTFREELLAATGLQAIFPLWKHDTDLIIRTFLDKGFKTLICAADAKHFSENQVGKTIDLEFIQNLSSHVDPCGENGEFHTFVFDGPIFNKALTFQQGKVVKKTYNFQKLNTDGVVEDVQSSFWFQDLLS
jgi:uncharacterized protein (TIGR00290 family)